MGQFSVKIMGLSGSVLSGTQHATITSDGKALPGGYSWSSLTIAQAVSLLTNNGTASLGSLPVAGMVVTVNLYDKRGQLTQTRETLREVSSYGSSAPTEALINRQKDYNAFGEVSQEIDPRGNVWDYSYNTMGKVIQRLSPTVSWTAENGAQAAARPTDIYYYDLSGRVIGVRDPNGNLNTKSLLAGTGYGGDEALTLTEFHADSGKVQNRYDIFNDLRGTTNEVGKTEDYTYDNRGLLTEQKHQQRADGTQLIDYYGYDSLGNRIWRYNSLLGSGVKETTDYDALGRITVAIEMGGDATSRSYVWNNTFATAGLGIFGGWANHSANAAGKGDVVVTDYFGRTVDKWDYGAHDYNYTFNSAGQLTLITNSAGLSTAYTYYNTGLIASITSGSNVTTGTRMVSTYRYDRAGNRTYEAYVKETWSAGTVTSTRKYQTATATWDALNRMTALVDSGSGTTGTTAEAAGPIDVKYEYDLAGNIRRMKATYRGMDDQGYVDTTVSNQDYWYKYDSMNRFVITKGMLNGMNASGQFVSGDAARGSGSIWASFMEPDARVFTYTLDGQRASMSYEMIDPFSMTGGTVTAFDNYTYTEDGYLSSVATSNGYGGYYTTSYTRDAMGRVASYSEVTTTNVLLYSRAITYNNKSQITRDVTQTRDGSGNVNWSTTDYYFNAVETAANSGLWRGVASGGTYMGGVVTYQASNNIQYKSGGGTSDTPDTATWNTFTWWDNALQTRVEYKKDISSTTVWNSYYALNNAGQLASANIQDGRDRTVSFVLDASGQVLQRDEVDGSSNGDPRQIYYYFNGIRIGDISNNGTSDTDYGQSIVDRQRTLGTGAFKWGASTGTDFADFDQSYDLINGLNYEVTASSYTVQAGDTLEGIALQLWGDASYWYLIADANGLVSSQSLVVGQNLIIPNKVHNSHNNADTYRVYDPNKANGNISPTAPKKANKCGTFGIIIMVAIAVAVTAITAGAAVAALVPGAATASGGGILGGLSALAGGTTGLGVGAIGIGAGAAALGSVVSQGFGVATKIQDKFSWKGVALSALAGGATAGLGGLNLFGVNGIATVGNAAIQGGISNILTQGIGVATKLQHSFSFAAIAAAGIGAGIGAWAGSNWGLSGFAAKTIPGMAGGIAGAAATSLVSGHDFGDTLMSQLPSIIGNTIGNLVADGIAGSDDPKLPARNKFAQADTGIRSDAPTPEEQYLAEIVVTARRLKDGAVQQGRNLGDRIDRFFGTNLFGHNPHTKRSSSDRAYEANLIFRASSGPSYAKGDPGAYFFAPDHPVTGRFTVQSRAAFLRAADAIGGFVNSNFGAGSTVGSGLDYLYRGTLGPGTLYDTAIVKPFYAGVDLLAQTPLGDPGTIMTLESNGLTAPIGALGSGVRGLAALRSSGAVVGEGSVAGRQVLYHYTNEAGMIGIADSNSLNPSLWRVGTKDVRYGNGQYVSDIVPGTRTLPELSYDFLRNPFQGSRFTHYVEIDATGLGAVQGRAGVYVIPNETPLDLTGRLISSGRVPGQ